MATSHPDKQTGTGAPAPTANVEETVSLSNDAAPVAATGGDAAASASSAATASQEQSSAEAAPVPTTAGPSTAVEHDPAPVQPPIQPVSISIIQSAARNSPTC